MTTRLRGLVGLTLSIVLLVLAGCSATTQRRSLPFGPSDVESVQVYMYRVTPDTQVKAWTLHDRRAIDSLMVGFQDVPTNGPRPADSRFVRAKAQGMRFVLRGGGTAELTQIQLDDMTSVIFWPDGQVASLAGVKSLLQVPPDATGATLADVPTAVVS